MDQVRNVRETAAFARRIVCRTLTVLGGAAAGTAIAWCLSTATAGAQTPVDVLDGSSPVLPDVVVAPFGETLDTLTERLPEAPPSVDPLDQVSETTSQLGVHTPELSDGDVGELVQSSDPVEPVERPAVPVQVVDVAAGSDTPRLPVARADPVGTPTDTGAGSRPSAEPTIIGSAGMTGMSDGGRTATTLPEQPSWPAPFSPTPPSAPVSGHTSHTGANPADSSPSAALSWLDRVPGSASTLTASAAEPAVAGRAGDQPGTAPD